MGLSNAGKSIFKHHLIPIPAAAGISHKLVSSVGGGKKGHFSEHGEGCDSGGGDDIMAGNSDGTVSREEREEQKKGGEENQTTSEGG